VNAQTPEWQTQRCPAPGRDRAGPLGACLGPQHSCWALISILWWSLDTQREEKPVCLFKASLGKYF
jgi:hypothetical protein